MYDAWEAQEHSLGLEPRKGEVEPEARGVPRSFSWLQAQASPPVLPPSLDLERGNQHTNPQNIDVISRRDLRQLDCEIHVKRGKKGHIPCGKLGFVGWACSEQPQPG